MRKTVNLNDRSISILTNMRYELNVDTEDINELLYLYYKEMRLIKEKYYELGYRHGLIKQRCRNAYNHEG